MKTAEADSLIQKVTKGFKTLTVSEKFKKKAIEHLKTWLTDKQYQEYVPQIKYLVDQKKWDVILDSFYQVMPFGTGGRRGRMGIGPNRINRWAIRSSAQGHSQYLLKKHGRSAQKKGVVLAYDVRFFHQKGIYSEKLPNPVWGLNCKDLAMAAAEVYAANGIKVYFFDERPFGKVPFPYSLHPENQVRAR